MRYTIINKNATIFEVEFDKTDPIYAAHFPGHPITPGVCLVQTASELVGLAMGKSVRMRRAKNIKFISVLDPQVSAIAVFDIRLSEGEAGFTEANTIITSGQNTIAKITATYETTGGR